MICINVENAVGSHGFTRHEVHHLPPKGGGASQSVPHSSTSSVARGATKPIRASPPWSVSPPPSSILDASQQTITHVLEKLTFSIPTSPNLLFWRSFFWIG